MYQQTGTATIIKKPNYYRQYSAKLKDMTAHIKKQRNMPALPPKAAKLPEIKQCDILPLIQNLSPAKLASNTKPVEVSKKKKQHASPLQIGYLSTKLARIRSNFEIQTKWRAQIDHLNDNQPLREYTLSRKLADFKSVNQLVAFFKNCMATEVARSQTELAWAIFVWIAHNIDYDMEGYASRKFNYLSPDSVLKSGRAVCSGYSSLFAHLCMHNRIQCLNVSGYAKQALNVGFKRHGGESGSAIQGKENDHAWNAIKLNGNW
jgi:transglutaminase-like putative cysteine protease